ARPAPRPARARPRSPARALPGGRSGGGRRGANRPWATARRRGPGRRSRDRNRRASPSRRSLALHFPEVEANGLLQLGARAGRGLGVLQDVEVEGQWHTLLLHAVELGREAAALVGLREDELGPLEGAVVARELLNGLDQHPLDRLRAPGGGR